MKKEYEISKQKGRTGTRWKVLIKYNDKFNKYHIFSLSHRGLKRKKLYSIPIEEKKYDYLIVNKDLNIRNTPLEKEMTTNCQLIKEIKPIYIYKKIKNE